MVSRFGGAALVLVLTLAAMPDSRAAGPTTGAAHSPPPARPPAPSGPAAPAPAGGSAPVGKTDPGPPPQVSQDAAARARMHECAHQWSSIKKAGNAGATTWKEFSATCLVVSR